MVIQGKRLFEKQTPFFLLLLGEQGGDEKTYEITGIKSLRRVFVS